VVVVEVVEVNRRPHPDLAVVGVRVCRLGVARVQMVAAATVAAASGMRRRLGLRGMGLEEVGE
jgi:hypothetical protein